MANNDHIFPDWLSLPEDILFKIFDFLHPDDLLRCGQVCSIWRKISLYPLFWSQIFSSRSRHSLNILDLRSDQINNSTVWADPRDVYITVRHSASVPGSLSPGFSNHIAYFWRSRGGWYPPNFLLIGPSRNVFYGGDYEVTSLFTPTFNTNSLPVNCITLRSKMGAWHWQIQLTLIKSYPLESHLAYPAKERLEQSSLLAEKNPADGYCNMKTLDCLGQMSQNFAAFIYLIHGENACEEDLILLKREFEAFLKNFHQQPNAPVLVCLTWKKVKPRLTLYQVVQILQLHNLQRPWAAYDWDVKKKQGFMEGLNWLALKVMS